MEKELVHLEVAMLDSEGSRIASFYTRPCQVTTGNKRFGDPDK